MPLIIVSALPAALAGIVWMLFLTGTHAERAGADRRDHDDGRRHREQHSDGLVRAPAAERRRAAAHRRARSGRDAASGRC